MAHEYIDCGASLTLYHTIITFERKNSKAFDAFVSPLLEKISLFNHIFLINLYHEKIKSAFVKELYLSPKVGLQAFYL